ncbi:MAG: hypothetical protein ACE5JM_13440 [Armatimonadota bacterium]
MTVYLTREDTLAIGAQQLTDEYDEGDPPVYTVPDDISRIKEIIAVACIQEAAADDIATAAVQFRGGAVGGTPTFPVAAGGIGAINVGVGQETAQNAIHIKDVDIPLKHGLPLQLWGLLAGEAGTVGNMSVTAVLA